MSDESNVPLEDGIRARLRRLVEEHTQAGIARVTETPQSSVSRYLKDRRIPADFCARVGTGLLVNGDWLLLGRGEPYLVDSVADVPAIREPLVELAQALDAVGRMPIVGLLDDSRRQHLWELQRVLDRVDRIEDRLRREVMETLDRVQVEFAQTYRHHDNSRATSLLDTIGVLARLARDPRAQRTYQHVHAYYLEQRGRVEEALEVQRELFRQFVAAPDDPRAGEAIEHFLRLLFKTLRIPEASRIARAQLALNEDRQDEKLYWICLVARGMCELEMGRVSDAVRTLSTAIPRLPSGLQSIWRVNHLVALHCEGDLSFAEVVELATSSVGDHAMSRKATGRTLALHALCNGRVDDITLVLDRFGSDLRHRDAELHESLTTHLESLRRALDRRDGSTWSQFRSRPDLERQCEQPEFPRRIESLIFTAQLARVDGVDDAVDWIRRVDAELVAEPSRVPYLSLSIVHHRNVLEARARLDESLVASARTFFAELQAGGAVGVLPPIA